MVVIFLLEMNKIVFFVKKNLQNGTRRLFKTSNIDNKLLHNFANKLCFLKIGC